MDFCSGLSASLSHLVYVVVLMLILVCVVIMHASGVCCGACFTLGGRDQAPGGRQLFEGGQPALVVTHWQSMYEWQALLSTIAHCCVAFATNPGSVLVYLGGKRNEKDDRNSLRVAVERRRVTNLQGQEASRLPAQETV